MRSATCSRALGDFGSALNPPDILREFEIPRTELQRGLACLFRDGLRSTMSLCWGVGAAVPNQIVDGSRERGWARKTRMWAASCDAACCSGLDHPGSSSRSFGTSTWEPFLRNSLRQRGIALRAGRYVRAEALTPCGVAADNRGGC